MKRSRLLAPLVLLTACGGGGPQPLNVTLVDGIGEPLQPLAAAWRVGPPPSSGSLPWNALPVAQSSWSLPLLPSARFQIAFRCPDVGGTQFYVSLDLMRNELGNNLLVRCPSAYANATANVSGAFTPALTTGIAFSARGQVSATSTSFSGLSVPLGPGKEVAVLGQDSTGTPYFGRLTSLNITGPTTVGPLSLTPTSTLSVTTPPGFFSYAGLVLASYVPLDLASWTGGTQSVPRPSPVVAGDLFQFWTCHGFSCALQRKDANDPAVAPSASLSLSVPPLSLSGNESHTSSTLPTFSNLTSGGFSPGLGFLGYALFLGEPGIRYWRHFVSPGALGSSSSYHVDVETAPGMAGVVPSPGSTVQLRATAFAGDQPLSALLAARPIPGETFPGHTLFLDRMWPVQLETALLQTTLTW
ncbi:hypothetical protein Mlute_02767 [Meiothermus luteus]|uniref:Uncharacterized protein n=1 Tax=Meiothermus luteus TaxID=2026184 RepID=A0A399EH24_9DEIN|nr:ArsR family transcriptional regulator [Meiothermus luteus]RIH81552.1 hypothetical protein Mlute_02767 [Meiothermus luteus]